jgi:hypothetical protein
MARAGGASPLPPDEDKSSLSGTISIKSLYSTNVAETGAPFEIVGDENGPPPPPPPQGRLGPPPNRTLVATSVFGDRGLEPGFNLKKYFVNSDNEDLTLTAEGSAIFYSTQQAYNYESIEALMEYNHYFETWDTGASFSYFDTWYDGVHSQAYWALKPQLTYNFNDDLDLQMAFEITRATYGTPSWNYTPSAKLTYNWTEKSNTYFTVQYTIAQGNKAGFLLPPPPPPQLPPTVVSGDLFAYYTTLAFILGSSLEVPLGFTLKGYYELEFTNYAAESLQPPGVGARSDTVTTWDISLGHPVIWKWLNISGEINYIDNDSSGFNGTTFNEVPQYSYNEWIYTFQIAGNF